MEFEQRYVWQIAEEDRPKATEWTERLDVPRVVAHLLMVRDVHDLRTGERFLSPSADNLADPLDMEGVKDALDRIRFARERGEKVLVFGDYDVDGIAGTAILVNALRKVGVDCVYGLPSRLVDGYGLRPCHVDAAVEDGVGLIITVDNGINAHDAAEKARALGVGLIVTDHHQLDGPLPKAAAVVNPVVQDPGGPSGCASGAAVAFKLAWALTGTRDDVDIAALGTVADVVPLRGENRDLVATGLEVMLRDGRPGLRALASLAGTPIEKVTTEIIGFQLAPRMNAVGRLEEAEAALRLLLTQSPREAAGLARILDAANEERRRIEDIMLKEALVRLDTELDPSRRTIVLAGRGWHSGVVGIVASKLQRRYNRPAMLIAVGEDGIGKGSGRSMPQFNLVDALVSCSNHLEAFGGHPAAAGITIREDEIEAFSAAFENEAARRIDDVDIEPTLAIDALVSLSEIDSRLIRSLDRLEPFGHSNPTPVFCSYGVRVLEGSFRKMKGKHIAFSASQGNSATEAIGFNMADRFREEDAAGPVRIAYTPRFDTWHGTTKIQLVLKDIQPDAAG